MVKWSRRASRILILLSAPPSPFMKTDINLLKKHFRVEVMIYDGKRVGTAWRVMQKIISGRVGLVLFWFAIPSFGFGVSIVARLLFCPIVLVTGGYDIANMPEVGFGSMIRPKLRLLVIAMLRMANVILPFSKSAMRDVLLYARPRRMVVCYPAVDVERFHPAPNRERERLVVTAAFSVASGFIQHKGLDTFVRAAEYVPGTRFLLIGHLADESAQQLRATAPSNVEFTDRRVPDEELVQIFQLAKVYVQASAHEGFGVAMAEAMAAGCVPVAVNATAMPEVVGETGYYAAYGDPRAFAVAITKALEDDGTLALKAQERIIGNFTLARRERILVHEISRYLSPHT